MVTIARFSKPEDAHLARLRLEAGGVAAYVQDEYTVQTNWLWSDAIGGVRLQVAEEDVPTATDILQQPPCEDAPTGMPACPQCQSTNTSPDEGPRRFAFLTLFLVGFPFLHSRTKWQCQECGHRWDEKNVPRNERG